MGWINPFLKNVVVAGTTLELAAQFFSFSKWMHEKIQEHLLLVVVTLVAYAFYAYVIYDADLYAKTLRRKGRLKGASRRHRS